MIRTSLLREWIQSKMKANQSRWLSFFNKYNIPTDTKQPVDDIVTAYKSFGKPVAKDLSVLLAYSDVKNYSGEDLSKTAESVENYLDWASVLVVGVKSIASDSETTTQTTTNNNQPEDEDNSKPWIIGFSVLIVVLISVFTVIKIRRS